MDLDRLLLLVAFRHRIAEPDFASGFSRTQTIIGRNLDQAAFRNAVERAMADDLIYEPVRIPPCALQCQWCLEVTPAGAATVQAMADEQQADIATLIARFAA